jgi:hypothetical protein
MKVPDFKEIQTEIDELDRVQSNIALYAKPLSENVMIQGVLLKDIALTTSETLVEHKLGTDYQGWIIVDKNANANVYVSSKNLPKRFLALTATATVTVSIWVF